MCGGIGCPIKSPAASYSCYIHEFFREIFYNYNGAMAIIFIMLFLHSFAAFLLHHNSFAAVLLLHHLEFFAALLLREQFYNYNGAMPIIFIMLFHHSFAAFLLHLEFFAALLLLLLHESCLPFQTLLENSCLTVMEML